MRKGGYSHRFQNYIYVENTVDIYQRTFFKTTCILEITKPCLNILIIGFLEDSVNDSKLEVALAMRIISAPREE